MSSKEINDESVLKEYYEIFRTVNDYDKNLLTVKGWGVTLSLAALAWGFQHSHYGLFLVASLSGIGFWLIEGAMKKHQMRYYYRMREIEVLRYERIKKDAPEAIPSPLIDSSWSYAGLVYEGSKQEFRPMLNRGVRKSYRRVWFFTHVLLPHMLSVVAGLILFCLGKWGVLGEMKW